MASILLSLTILFQVSLWSPRYLFQLLSNMTTVPISAYITVAVIHDHGLTNASTRTVRHSCISLGLWSSSLRAVFGVFLGSRSCIAGHLCHFRVCGLLAASFRIVGWEYHILWLFKAVSSFTSWMWLPSRLVILTRITFALYKMSISPLFILAEPLWVRHDCPLWNVGHGRSFERP